jgi:hypothetical protein
MLRGHSQDSVRLGHIAKAARLGDDHAGTETERFEKLKASLAEDIHSMDGLKKMTGYKN